MSPKEHKNIDKNEELYKDLVERVKEIARVQDPDVMVETLKLMASMETNRKQVETELIKAKSRLDVAIVKSGYRLKED